MSVESQAARDARIDMGAVLGAVVVRLPRIVLVTLGLLALAFVFLMFQPKLYESSAGILVEPRSNAFTRLANEQAPLNAADAGVVSSQIELLKSRDTLMAVIDRLKLRDVPEFNGANAGFSPLTALSQALGRNPVPPNVDEVVLANLLQRMTVIQERDSRIISVLVRSQSPDLAAAIANAVAAAHVARRAGLSLSDTVEASGWLGTEIEKLRVSVNEAESAVAKFRIDNDMFNGGNNTSLVDQQLSTIANQVSAAEERNSAAMSRANLIRGLIDRGQPIDGVPDVRESAVIVQLSQEKARLQGERAQRSATLLSSHPTIVALTAQINELENQINIEGRRVADALEAQSQIEADLVTSLKSEMTRVKGSASTATQDTVTLDGLEREAKAQRDLLAGYLQNYSEAMSRTGANSALPDVRVVSEAAPAVTPASPKTTLILIAVGIVAAATQIGITVFGELMSGRAIFVPTARAVPERTQDELEAVPFNADELEPDQRWEEAEVELEPTAVEVAPPVQVEPVMVEPLVIETGYGAEDEIADETVAAYAETMVEPERVADVRAPAVQSPRSLRRSEPSFTAYDQTIAQVAGGQTRLAILAGSRSNDDCEALAEAMIVAAIDAGLSVALVDAGSAAPGQDLGITDLSLDRASFGDVVHRSDDSGFAEIPWGQGRAIDRRSAKTLTLVEALGDLYEVVILMTGRVGMASSLPLFADLGGRLLLVGSESEDPAALMAARTELAEAGYGQAEIVPLRHRIAA